MDEQTRKTDERLGPLETYKRSKETQQISLPLDDPSKNIIKEIIDENTSDFDSTGLYAFGGDGSDGELSISSGTTTVDIDAAPVFVKNYSSISITGTANLAFSNPVANGSIVVLKCAGDFTLTSSSGDGIDIRSLGGTGGGAPSDNNGILGTPGNGTILTFGGGGGGVRGANPTKGTGGYCPFSGVAVTIVTHKSVFKVPYLKCGSGGGSGASANSGGHTAGGGAGGDSCVASGSDGVNGSGSQVGTGSGGAGGRGAGALYIEVAGNINITGTINAVGANGSNGSGTGQNAGGGGGGGGHIVILYAGSVTADSGTYAVTGGSAGTGVQNGGTGGVGATGAFLVAKYKA